MHISIELDIQICIKKTERNLIVKKKFIFNRKSNIDRVI